MRRQIVTITTVVALASPVAGSAAAAHVDKAAAKKKVVTKKLVGTVAQADRWGTVQVVVTVKTTTTPGSKKATRAYTQLGGSFTYHTDRSQYIMERALPILREEFLRAQSANVQLVSGASYTSQAFEQSLQAALAKAKL
jgi:uncharacterized protein with FMN-binding domain